MEKQLGNKVHSVEHRIVSISQPRLRPIVRKKVKALVEFEAKFDLSLDSEGYGRIEKISFEAYNESACLKEASECILADQVPMQKLINNQSTKIISIETK